MRKPCRAEWSDPRFGELLGQLCDKLQAIRFALAALERASPCSRAVEGDALNVAMRSVANGIVVLQRIARLRAESDIEDPTLPVMLVRAIGPRDSLSRSLQGEPVAAFLQAEFDEFASVRAKFDLLTPREREVFALVTSGLLNKQVAGLLFLSETTVKIHRGNLMRKMCAESLAHLVRMAEALGIREPVSRYKLG